MAFILEDGSGLSDSNAFVSVAEADAYHALRGNNAWTTYPLGDKEGAVIRATSYLSKSIAWKGYRVKGRNQALAWPRGNVTDCEGYGVPADVVPWEVADATAEVALREAATPGVMTVDVTMTDSQGRRIKSETVGALSVTYELSSSSSASIPILPIVDSLLACLVESGAGANSMLHGRSYRV